MERFVSWLYTLTFKANCQQQYLSVPFVKDFTIVAASAGDRAAVLLRNNGLLA
jgi:hypothetical protein